MMIVKVLLLIHAKFVIAVSRLPEARTKQSMRPMATMLVYINRLHKVLLHIILRLLVIV